MNKLFSPLGRTLKEKVVYFEWVRFTNIYNQKPVVEDELKFIAKYPEIARKIFSMLP